MELSGFLSKMNPLRRSDQVFSIRRRLLGLSLLAVLGGYGLLIVATALLASQERRNQHRATAASVRQLLLDTRPAPQNLEAVSESLVRLVSPNVLAWVETEQGIPHAAGGRLPRSAIQMGVPLARLPAVQGGLDAVAVVRAGDFTYLTSLVPVQVGGRSVRVRFLEDITQKLEQERLLLLLQLLAAGIATLFTGLLLRPVLVRTLAPLHELGQRMRSISTDTLDTQRVSVDAQPLELAPIALAFNDLLDRLSASWERQRGFANEVSHELRTPISLISSYASNLRRRSADLSVRQTEQLALIEEEAGRMGRLVANLLKLSRSGADRTLMPFGAFDVAQAIERVAGRLDARSQGRLQICAGATYGTHTYALGDVDRFEQCLTNLIENALKFDAQGGPIRLRLDASLDRVVVHVIDAGPGVPAAEKGLIFKRFGRGRHAAGVPGSGVGLSVVKALMETMAGSVSVADGPEGGADFQLRLKGAAPPPAA